MADEWVWKAGEGDKDLPKNPNVVLSKPKRAGNPMTAGVEVGHVVVVKTTEAAILCRWNDASQAWVPKSQLRGGDIDADAEKGDEGELAVTKWFAGKAGL